MDKLGATGRFPQGKLNPTDEGELTIAISEENGNVRIDFGTPTARLAFPPEIAIQLALSIMSHATVIRESRQ